jgi:dienelactone hydrolase
MRLFEILLVSLLGVAAVWLLTGRWQGIGRCWLVAGILVLLAVHVFYEGAHWQMIPAYLGAVALCLAAWLLPGPARFPSLLIASSLLLLSGLSVGFSFVLPIFHLPQPTGPYAVGTTTLYLKDPSRTAEGAPGSGSARELMVQIWYPAEPSSHPLERYRAWRETRFINSYQSVVKTNSRRNAPLASVATPFPVVLFDPGWRGRRTQNTFLTEELASHGYFVAAIDHPYNAGIVAFPDGRVIRGTSSDDVAYPNGSTAAKVQAAWELELRKWVADERFVLDQLQAMNQTPGTEWHGRLDTQRTAAVGQSFGGSASTALCAEDKRIRGSVNMDGWFFSAIRIRGANQPILIMNSSPPDPSPNPEADVEAQLDASDFADTNASLREFGGYRVYVNGAEHEDFTDQPLLSPLRSVAQRGSLPAWKIQQIVRAYVLAFLDETIRGQNPPILRAHARAFPEASLEAWPADKHEGPPAVPAGAR